MDLYNLIDSYNDLDEENRLQSTNARRVEFLTTIEVLQPFVRQNMKLFDCGCGVGIYSMLFAQKGIHVTALDLVPKHIKRLKKLAYDQGVNIDASIGTATDLSSYDSNMFDITLCMGPLYHLLSEEEQIQCIHECIRVTKKEGILAFAYISPFSVFPCVIRGNSSRINLKLEEKIVDDRKISSDDELCFWTDNFYHSPDDIELLLKKCGLVIADHVATDGQSIAFQSTINSMNEEQFSVWMDYHRRVCRERTLLGSSNHGLIIARKKE